MISQQWFAMMNFLNGQSLPAIGTELLNNKLKMHFVKEEMFC